MAINAGLMSSDSVVWGTPQPLFDLCDRVFGPFDMDVCANAENAKCDRYLTEADNGLIAAWGFRAWCNPPYGKTIALWIGRAFAHAQGGAGSVTMLLPARTDTRYWWDYCTKAQILFLPGRLRFNDAGSAPFPSAIVHFAAGLPWHKAGASFWDWRADYVQRFGVPVPVPPRRAAAPLVEVSAADPPADPALLADTIDRLSDPRSAL